MWWAVAEVGVQERPGRAVRAGIALPALQIVHGREGHRRRLARRGSHDRCRRRGGVVAGRTRACNRTMGGNRHRCSGAIADGLFRWSLQTRRHLAQQGRGDIWSGWGRLYAGLGRHRERPEPLSPQAVHVVCAVLRLTTGHGEHRQIRWRVGRCILEN